MKLLKLIKKKVTKTKNAICLTRARVMMMKKINWLYLLLIILSGFVISQTNQRETNSIEPFSILSLESELIEIKYIIIGYTKTVPPRTIKKENSSIYDLVFKLSFGKQTETWDAPIYVLLKGIDQEIQIIQYDEELTKLTVNIFPEYLCRVEVKQRGSLQATLGYKNENGEIRFDTTNPFLTKRITLK